MRSRAQKRRPPPVQSRRRLGRCDNGCEGVVDRLFSVSKETRFARLLRVRLEFLGQFVRTASESLARDGRRVAPSAYTFQSHVRAPRMTLLASTSPYPNRARTVEASKIARSAAFRVSAEVGNFAFPLPVMPFLARPLWAESDCPIISGLGGNRGLSSVLPRRAPAQPCALPRNGEQPTRMIRFRMERRRGDQALCLSGAFSGRFLTLASPCSEAIALDLPKSAEACASQRAIACACPPRVRGAIVDARETAFRPDR